MPQPATLRIVSLLKDHFRQYREANMTVTSRGLCALERDLTASPYIRGSKRGPVVVCSFRQLMTVCLLRREGHEAGSTSVRTSRSGSSSPIAAWCSRDEPLSICSFGTELVVLGLS